MGVATPDAPLASGPLIDFIGNEDLGGGVHATRRRSAADVADDLAAALSPPAGATGPTGPTGATGPTGPQGAIGSGLPPGFVSVGVFNNTGDPNNDIDFVAGKCRDAADAIDITLASTLIKRLDAAWTVGSNQGGLDTGSKANNTFYYLWVIRRPDTEVVDALFSLSATSPTMPTSYTQKQRVGWVRTDGSGNIRPFTQEPNNLDEFRYTTPIGDVAVTNLSTSRTSYALTLPPSCVALFRAVAEHASIGNAYVLITPLTETDAVPTLSTGLLSLGWAATATPSVGTFATALNSSSQLGARSNTSGTSFRISTYGCVWRRGIIP